MANPNAPFGLRPVGYLNGSPWSGKGRMYHIRSDDSSNSYAIGDPVVINGNSDANGVPDVTIATAGTSNLVLGPICGMGSSVYGGPGTDPATPQTMVIPTVKLHDYYVMVADDPNIIFAVREPASGTAFVAGDAGNNVSLVAGSNNGFVSGWRIDNSTEANTAALQMKMLGLQQIPGNTFGYNAIWLCLINQHSYKYIVAGV